jgi:hypothetical protein
MALKLIWHEEKVGKKAILGILKKSLFTIVIINN